MKAKDVMTPNVVWIEPMSGMVFSDPDDEAADAPVAGPARQPQASVGA